ncbi:hypothetical protein MBANPS3_000771 [Mucor bainieri]
MYLLQHQSGYWLQTGNRDDLIAFKDRSPSAQVHLLIIPKNHIRTVKNLDGGDVVLLEKMIALGKELLRQQGFNPDDTTQVRQVDDIDHFANRLTW